MINGKISDVIDEVRTMIEYEDNAYLDLILAKNADSAVMINEIKPLVPHGKKMRSLLVLLGYGMAGGQDKKKILQAACSMDFLQHAMLIFDDIMDCAEIRHGNITIHQKIKHWVKKKYSLKIFQADHYGRSIAELAGLFALECSHDILARSGFDPALKIKALLMLDEITMITVVGQSADLEMGLMPFGKDLSEQNIMKMMENKTGVYTIGGPVKLGAILAGSSNEFLEKITSFAIPLGIAFQIRDDIIGLYGNETKTGKSAGSDVIEGKRTLLMLKAWENASLTQKWHLKRTLGNKKAGKESIEDVREIVEETGSLEYCENLINALAICSKRELNKIQIKDEYKIFLEELIRFLTERDY